MAILKEGLRHKRPLLVRDSGSAFQHHPSQSPGAVEAVLPSHPLPDQCQVLAPHLRPLRILVPINILIISDLHSSLLAGVPDLSLFPPINTPFLARISLMEFKSDLTTPLSKTFCGSELSNHGIRDLSNAGLCLFLLPHCSFPAPVFSKNTTPFPTSKPLLLLFLLTRTFFLLLQKPKSYLCFKDHF